MEPYKQHHYEAVRAITNEVFGYDTPIHMRIVYINHGNVVGYVSWEQNSQHIHELGVCESHQRRGIGSALLAAVIEQLPTPITLHVDKNRSYLINFYNRAGFEVSGYTPNNHIIMTKI